MSYLVSVLKNSYSFINSILPLLNQMNISLKGLQMDHIAYQTSSSHEYEKLKELIPEIGKLTREGIVNNRKVAIIKLSKGLQLAGFVIPAFELIEPKPGQHCKSSFDHVEFVLNESFQEFLKKHPLPDWDTSAMNRSEFPKITYGFPEGSSVKFHLQNILDEI